MAYLGVVKKLTSLTLNIMPQQKKKARLGGNEQMLSKQLLKIQVPNEVNYV
jgi:hypothetical protein